MKRISTLLPVVAIVLTSALGLSVATASASEPWETPAQCSTQETREAHPAWYNTGGYCNPFDGFDEQGAT